MKREECTWWVNHLFNTAKVSEWNNGHVEDAREIETAQQMAIDALKQTAWIPVGERLPEVDVEVLTTTDWSDVLIAWLNKDGTWETEELILNNDEILAWMPLPEPYRGSDDND